MKYSKDKYFSCYSPNLKEYLVSNGFDILTSFIHIRENKTYWIFEKNDNLSIYLEQWTKNKNNVKLSS